MEEIEKTEQLRNQLQNCFDSLLKKIGKIQIGTSGQFPYGWRKAAKGRTIWRILEEVISKNLEQYQNELGIQNFKASESEVGVYDFLIVFRNETSPVYINVKSAVSGGKIQKDDISKGKSLTEFLEDDTTKPLLIATFYLEFNEDMTIEITKSIVFPLFWIPDIYINPSNNGNLQSSKYKDIKFATKRTQNEFYFELQTAMKVADIKKEEKERKKREKSNA